MSRLKNRNIRSKLQVFSTKTGDKNNNNITTDSGIDVKSNHEIFSAHPWSRITSASSEIEDEFKSEDKSSSSSISWADDYEERGSDLVGKEFERMERVLQRLEPIPTHYDKDEYKLWIKTFPCLSLTGQSTTPSNKLPKKLKENCDKTRSSEDKYRMEDSNMDKYLGELCSNSKTSSTNLGTNSTLNPNTLNLKFKAFLQISPVVLPQKSSAHQSRTSHWLQNFQDLKPLPPLPTPAARKKQVFSRNSDEFIILPPIKNNLSPFRSISAISGRRSVFHNKIIDGGLVIEENSDELDFNTKKSANKISSGRHRSRFINLD